VSSQRIPHRARLAALLCGLLAPAAASAADAPPAPAADAPAEVQPGVIEHGQAIEALRLGENLQAAHYAWASISRSTPSAEKYEGAQFALAEALMRLGFEQGAAEYYFEVARNRRTPALLPRALAGLDGLARRGLVAEEKLMRGVLVEADLGDLSDDVADFVHYYQGLADLRAGLGRWIDHDFDQVKPDGYYGNQTRYVRAVAKLQAGDSAGAMKLIDELLTKNPDKLTEARARLTRARLLYEAKRTDEALTEYLRVKQSNAVPMGEILLERAWSRFRAGAYHDAMGLLYSLVAPSNRDLFLPEQYVLRGLIYQRFCHFRAAKAAVSDFRRRYGAAIREVKAGKQPASVPLVRAAALERPEVMPYDRLYRAVADERARVEKMRKALLKGGLYDHLKKLYDSLEVQAGRAVDAALRQGAKDSAEQLLEAEEQANLLEYEVGVAIFRRMSDASGHGLMRPPAEKVPPGGPRTYYRFDGEFWTDELPDMRFLIQDRCVE
jgi:tetratricopeptide (TPR) repeat protein